MTGRDRPGDPDGLARRRRPDRLSDLLPEAARQLGLERELRLARAVATWNALIAEHVPPAVGACRLVGLEPDAIVVAVDEPIVAAELRMRAIELLDAFAVAPGGSRVRFLRIQGDAGRDFGEATVPARIIPSRCRRGVRHALAPRCVAHAMRLVVWPSVSS